MNYPDTTPPIILLLAIHKTSENNDAENTGITITFKVNNLSKAHLQYTNDTTNFTLNIPPNKLIEIFRFYGFNHSSIGTPNEYFNMLKLYHSDGTLAFEQNPMESKNWHYENGIFTLNITDNMLQ